MKKNLLFMAVMVAFAGSVMAQGKNLGEIKKTPTSPTIDGIADEGIWDQVDVIPLSNTAFVKGVNPASAMGKVKVLYDADSIYMFITIDDDVWKKDVGYGNPGGGHDDALECPLGFGDVDAKDHTTGAVDFVRVDVGVDYADTLAHYETNKPSMKYRERIEGNSFWGDVAEGGINAAIVLGQSAIGGQASVEFAVALSALPNSPDVLEGATMLLDVRYNDDDANADNPDDTEGFTKRESQQNLGSDFTAAQDGSWWWETPYNAPRVTLSSESIDAPATSVFDKASTPTFNVYPNPASGIVTINDAELGAQIDIINVAGQRLITSVVSSNSNSMNVSDLEPGVYFVKIGDAASRLVVR